MECYSVLYYELEWNTIEILWLRSFNVWAEWRKKGQIQIQTFVGIFAQGALAF